MGAALLRHALAAEPEPLRSLPVISAGVSARAGEPMTPHSVTALRKVGIDRTRNTPDGSLPSGLLGPGRPRPLHDRVTAP